MNQSDHRIRSVLIAAGSGAYTNDDQAAIIAGARRDGFFYTGQPMTPGYDHVRQPAEAASVMLVLEDGHVVHGDGVSVQYAGGSGRESPLRLRQTLPMHAATLNRALAGASVRSFRPAVRQLDDIGLPRALTYGASQALLEAAAYAQRRTIAETVADEFATGADCRAPVPVFAQSGEDRRAPLGRMILREVDALPHGLINHAPTLVGSDGTTLKHYVLWVADRVLTRRTSDAYAPTLHFDCYGTFGQTFAEVEDQARFLAELGRLVHPLRLRIEHPINAGSRNGQVVAMAVLRRELRRLGSGVQIVADEWCNTREDIEVFAAADACDMIHIKAPDLGSIEDVILSALICKRAGVDAYIGGSCTETERSAQICAAVAMGVGADLLLARPGMGVDEAVMVVRNEMARTRSLVAQRHHEREPE